MTEQYRDIANDLGPTDIEPKSISIPKLSYELPLNATDRLLLNIGNYDKYYDKVTDVNVAFYKGDEIVEESTPEDPVDNDGDGLYSYLLDGSHVEEPGNYKAVWTWKAKRGLKTYNRKYEVNYFAYFESPLYHSMTEEERTIVKSVISRFSDLFDNTLGRSRFNFFEQYQSTFGIERVAQNMDFACKYINAEMSPMTRYVIGGNAGQRFPRQWHSVLEVATYVEVLRHAVRTYVEQPAIAGGSELPYADRRDYLQRWSSVLEETKSSLRTQIIAMRRGHMALGASAALVSGGIYGNVGIQAQHAVTRGRMRSAYIPVVARYI